MDQTSIPLFRRGDFDAAVGVFFDGFSKIIVFLAVLTGTIHLDGATVFGTMMPGLFVSTLLLNGGLWIYYRRIARQRGDAELTAIPASVQSGRMFIWLFSIMLPTYLATGDAELAYWTGVLAQLVGSLVFAAGAFVMPRIMQFVPAGALFGALSGAAMAFLVLQPMNGILQMPLVGMLSLVMLLVLYLGRIETRLPAVLIVTVAGTAIAWATDAMDAGAIGGSLSHVGLSLPALTPQIFAPEVIAQLVKFIPIIVVFSLDEVVAGIQGVEQARSCGDEFSATCPLAIAGVAGAVGALFGNPLATGLYWGYPGWKAVGAGTGYHLGVLGMYALVCLTGLASVVAALVPEAVVLPILVFLGISTYCQAFEVTERRYYPAVVMASLPLVMSFMAGNAGEGSLVGFAAFDSGAAFTGLLLGCLFVFVIDNDWLRAAGTCAVALVLTLAGMIHSPMPILTNGYVFQADFVLAYAVLAIAFFVLHSIGFNQGPRAAERATSSDNRR